VFGKRSEPEDVNKPGKKKIGQMLRAPAAIRTLF